MLSPTPSATEVRPAPPRPPAAPRDRLGPLWLPGALLVALGLAQIWWLRLGTSAEIYVSGFGASGASTATAFNTALAGIGAGGLLVALAARTLPASPALAALFFWSLTGASLSFVAASRVTCTLGCPIPFTPAASWQDAVHVALACLGFGLALLAMLASARFGAGFRGLVPPTVLGVALPAAAGGILSLLSLAPGLGGWLELAATTVALGWLIAFAVRLGRRRRRPSPPAHENSAAATTAAPALFRPPA